MRANPNKTTKHWFRTGYSFKILIESMYHETSQINNYTSEIIVESKIFHSLQKSTEKARIVIEQFGC